jgi:hypothetical protein
MIFLIWQQLALHFLQQVGTYRQAQFYIFIHVHPEIQKRVAYEMHAMHRMPWECLVLLNQTSIQ